jgi:hypothetical protein
MGVISKMKLLNSLSLNTYNYRRCFPLASDISVESVKKETLESCIGHAETAKIISGIIGREILPNRVTTFFNTNDECIVAQYIGPRLPEGAISLPEGAEIRFVHVDFIMREKVFELFHAWNPKTLKMHLRSCGFKNADEVREIVKRLSI